MNRKLNYVREGRSGVKPAMNTPNNSHPDPRGGHVLGLRFTLAGLGRVGAAQ